MKRALALLFLLGCPSPKTPSAPSSIVVVAPKVSRVAIVRRHTIQKLSVPALPGQNAGGQNVESRSETEETVQAVDGLAIKKLLIDIKRDERAAQVASGTFKLPGMAGKKVELTFGEQLTITPPLSADDDDELRDRYRLLGQPDPFLVNAPTGVLAPGARVPGYELALRVHFARKSATASARVVDATVVHVGNSAFDVHLTIEGLQHRFHVTGSFDGKLTIDPATGWVRTFNMLGRFRGTAPEASGELVGEHLNDVSYEYR